ncbi:MAG: tetratricopeptide repeat protein [Desulforegulaceae bacterium]|nr:tetratricopeptide repeat protein [Desulforegulaceae bacterium]
MKEEKDLIEVPEIDAFTVFMKRAVDYTKENRQKVIIGILVFFVLLVVISSIPAFLKAKRENSFAELQKALTAVETQKDQSPDEIEQAFAVLNEKYNGSKAAALGDVYIARALYGAGEYEKAAIYYEKAANFFGESALPGKLSMYELGCLYFDRDPEKAGSYLKPLSQTKSFLNEDALFYMALAGDEKSIEVLKKDYPEGFYSNIINEKYNSAADLSVKK